MLIDKFFPRTIRTLARKASLSARALLSKQSHIDPLSKPQRREFLSQTKTVAFGGALLATCGAESSRAADDDQAMQESAQSQGSPEALVFVVSAVTQLRDTVAPANAVACQCLGYWRAGDGGGGMFYWSPGVKRSPDGAMVIESKRPGQGVGAWVRDRRTAEIDIRWFGAHGDGKADDTEAFSRALAYLVSFGIDVARPSNATRPALYLPGGKYRVRALPILQHTQNIKIRGDGSSATKILFVPDSLTPNGGLFELAQFTTDPKDQWQGDAQGFQLSDLYLGVEDAGPPHSGKDRRGFGVKDNGCGGLHIERVIFWGFRHGIVAPYGSDFSRFMDCEFRFNTTGIYLGPGSQQVHFGRLTFGCNREGIVLDAVPQGDIHACYFMDQLETDIKFENSGRGRTRFGVQAAQKIYRGMFSVRDCWFETGTSPESNDGFVAHLHSVSIGDGNDVAAGGVLVARSFVVSGARNMTKLAPVGFWLCENGSDNRIEDIRIWGHFIDEIVLPKNSGRVAAMKVERT